MRHRQMHKVCLYAYYCILIRINVITDTVFIHQNVLLCILHHLCPLRHQPLGSE